MNIEQEIKTRQVLVGLVCGFGHPVGTARLYNNNVINVRLNRFLMFEQKQNVIVKTDENTITLKTRNFKNDK